MQEYLPSKDSKSFPNLLQKLQEVERAFNQREDRLEVENNRLNRKPTKNDEEELMEEDTIDDDDEEIEEISR